VGVHFPEKKKTKEAGWEAAVVVAVLPKLKYTLKFMGPIDPPFSKIENFKKFP